MLVELVHNLNCSNWKEAEHGSQKFIPEYNGFFSTMKNAYILETFMLKKIDYFWDRFLTIPIYHRWRVLYLSHFSLIVLSVHVHIESCKCSNFLYFVNQNKNTRIQLFLFMGWIGSMSSKQLRVIVGEILRLSSLSLPLKR